MYLVSSEPFSITVNDIREAIGLRGRQLDGVISAGIASVCMMAGGRLRRETWAIPCDANFHRTITRMGRVVEYGPRRQLDGTDRRPRRDCTFVPNRQDIEDARVKIIRWCMRQPDICDALQREAWPHEVTCPGKLGLIAAVQTALEVA